MKKIRQALKESEDRALHLEKERQRWKNRKLKKEGLCLGDENKKAGEKT